VETILYRRIQDACGNAGDRGPLGRQIAAARKAVDEVDARLPLHSSTKAVKSNFLAKMLPASMACKAGEPDCRGVPASGDKGACDQAKQALSQSDPKDGHTWLQTLQSAAEGIKDELIQHCLNKKVISAFTQSGPSTEEAIVTGVLGRVRSSDSYCLAGASAAYDWIHRVSELCKLHEETSVAGAQVSDLAKGNKPSEPVRSDSGPATARGPASASSAGLRGKA
jgi:hypothetical protein